MPEYNNFSQQETDVQTEVGTGGAPWVALITRSGDDLLADTDYLIWARAHFGGDDVNGRFEIRTRTDDDTSIADKSAGEVEPIAVATDEGAEYWFVHPFTTDASDPADVVIEYRAQTIGQTVHADQISLKFLDLDDLGASNYEEVVIADDDVEYPVAPSWVTLAEITGATLGTDEWAVLGYVRVDTGSTARSYEVQLLGADDASSQTVLNRHVGEAADAADEDMVSILGRHNATSGTPALTVRAQEEHIGSNASNGGGYLIALRASAFADFQHDYTAGDFTVTGTEQTIAEVSDYTPSAAGNHWLAARANVSDTGGNSRIRAHIEQDTTVLFTGDDLPYHTIDNDPTDERNFGTAHMNNLAASEFSYQFRASRHSGDSDRTVEHRWLWMLNLNAAPAAAGVYPPFPQRPHRRVRM